MDQKGLIEVETELPTDWGNFRMIAFKSEIDNYVPHLALVHPNLDTNSIVPVRIHSECITGDLFHSKKCDCGSQLDKAMNYISEQPGILIYLRQEGRGIGIINKLKAYNKQAEGLDTIKANEVLGLKVDSRTYGMAIELLKELGVNRISLLTNNPEKIAAFKESSVELVSRIQLEISPSETNQGYLKTKKESMGHLLSK